MLFWISIYVLGVVVNAVAVAAESRADGCAPVDRAAWVRVCCFVAGSWASWAAMLLFFLWCVFDDIHNGRHL